MNDVLRKMPGKFVGNFKVSFNLNGKRGDINFFDVKDIIHSSNDTKYH